MNNISLETSTFGEQLGIYDFFNVIISGAFYIFSLIGILYTIYPEIIISIYSNITILGGTVLATIIFFVGLVIQELGSIADRKLWHVKEFAYRNCLKNTWQKKKYSHAYKDRIAIRQGKYIRSGNYVIHNGALLKCYIQSAEKILSEQLMESNPKKSPLAFDNVNRCIFSYCEYYVAVLGKDKKVEKMRALFAMARSFATCAWLIFVTSSLSLVQALYLHNAKKTLEPTALVILALICCVCPWIYYLFRLRMTKMMRYMVLILLGNYNACLHYTEEK